MRHALGGGGSRGAGRRQPPDVATQAPPDAPCLPCLLLVVTLHCTGRRDCGQGHRVQGQVPERRRVSGEAGAPALQFSVQCGRASVGRCVWVRDWGLASQRRCSPEEAGACHPGSSVAVVRPWQQVACSKAAAQVVGGWPHRWRRHHHRHLLPSPLPSPPPQVASATNDVAGDGTTTATVLTRAILVEGCKSVRAAGRSAGVTAAGHEALRRGACPASVLSPCGRPSRRLPSIVVCCPLLASPHTWSTAGCCLSLLLNHLIIRVKTNASPPPPPPPAPPPHTHHPTPTTHPHPPTSVQVAAGMNPMDLRRGINLAVDHVVAELKARAKMISTTEEIAQVGQRGARNACVPLWAGLEGAFCCVVGWAPRGCVLRRLFAREQGTMDAASRWLPRPPPCTPRSLVPCRAPLPAQVGTISANGEREIGELIARAMEKVGEKLGGLGATASGLACLPACLTGRLSTCFAGRPGGGDGASSQFH